MRQIGHCPKCGSHDVVKRKNFLMKSWGTVEVERWCCLSCGYSELWTPEDELEQLREERRENSGGKG